MRYGGIYISPCDPGLHLGDLCVVSYLSLPLTHIALAYNIILFGTAGCASDVLFASLAYSHYLMSLYLFNAIVTYVLIEHQLLVIKSRGEREAM